MNPMIEKLTFLWPEIIMLIGGVVCMLSGLAATAAIRKATVAVAAGALVLAAVAVVISSDPSFVGEAKLAAAPPMATFVKLIVIAIGLLLLLVAARVPERLLATIDSEQPTSDGRAFEPGLAVRGEFFGFFLFSLTGVMLCAASTDLVWLFLALELVSLPTYVMIAISRDRFQAQESAVKYFYLGALAVAIFLYGFALIYGATGFTEFGGIREAVLTHFKEHAHHSPLLLTGVILAVVGISFKIAAAPMQFYAADVYEGAATPVTAFLAFVPKAAGFVSLILLLNLVRSPAGELPGVVTLALSIMAAVTMTYGNVLGLLQTNVKRMLGYSSIAHSGYMIVGLLAVTDGTGGALGNGAAGILFYLIAYGLGNLGAFAVLGCLEKKGDEAQTVDDMAGLSRRSPVLAAILLISMLSLIGLPPMVGFIGKIYLFGPAVKNHLWLVVLAVINSAISAVYYLRVTAACYFGEPAGGAEGSEVSDNPPRRAAALFAAIAAIVVGLTAGWLVDAARDAVQPRSPVQAKIEPPRQASVE
jgi:NADH-quinone oxidoreductase subunit N